MSNEPPDRKDDELASNDVAIVGRAFRRSLVVLLLVGAVVAGISFVLERKQSTPQPQVSELDTPPSRQLPLDRIPVARFTDITKEAGIAFVHNNGHLDFNDHLSS